MSARLNYLDGNAAAGELSAIFAIDITSAEGECANCGAKKRFAEAHLYVRGPGLIARCPLCGHVILRLANAQHGIVLDIRGMTRLVFNRALPQNMSGKAPDFYRLGKNKGGHR
jgi:hypothetical protein